jgi:hypothetical protein
MPFSTTETQNILNWALGRANAPSSKSAVYIGLLTNDPEADNGTCTELSGDTYARVQLTQLNNNGRDLMGNASDRAIQNTKQINWTKATVRWPEVKGIALYTAASGTAAPFYYAKIPQSFVVEPGEVALFEAGKLKIAMSATDVDIT